MRLHNQYGQRKYLNQAERLRFFERTKTYSIDTKLFCQLLFYTGARISEIHKLKPDSIDFSNGTVIIETLKKRHRGVFREIPLPPHLLDDLEDYIEWLKVKKSLWPFSLRTASRRLKAIMEDLEIIGVRGCARGLRHGFAVHAVNKVPLTLVKKWLGHATLETTEIYLQVLGMEERALAKKVWTT
ncbi:MAG: site-specific integrase [Bacteroidota bacterium]